MDIESQARNSLQDQNQTTAEDERSTTTLHIARRRLPLNFYERAENTRPLLSGAATCRSFADF